jgi:periplasmic protein TonB
LSMFEQSILFDQPTGKKAGALAASLTVQVAGVCVLILIPLFYNDRLPDIHVWTPLTLPSPPAQPAPQPMEQVRPMLAPSKIPVHVFQLPSPEPRLLAPSSAAWGEPAIGVVAMPHDLPMMGLRLTPSMHLAEIAPPPVRPVEARNIAPQKPIEVGGKVQEAKLLKRVMPIYPPLARQARISGIVHLMAVIAKDGTIQDLRVLGGHPLLISTAVNAVRQWVYRPTLLNDQPVEVMAPIDVIFTLAH